jgi:hypothetical protein
MNAPGRRQDQLNRHRRTCEFAVRERDSVNGGNTLSSADLCFTNQRFCRRAITKVPHLSANPFCKGRIMLEAVTNLFTRRDPRREAALGLARIISRHEMSGLSYDQGIAEDRRIHDEWHVALGIWLFPCESTDEAADIDVSYGVPAVTIDIRRQGFGVMTPVKLQSEHFMIAVPHEEEDSWQFFRCNVCHNTRRPGNWFQLGIQVERTVDLEGTQRVAFREHIQRINA